MRGYNRNKYDLAPYVARTLSGSETAAKIAAGDPPPVHYSVRPGEALPVNLRRAILRK